ncbi:MAG TPA: UDP-3-O-(3-hydroxymyristoyl)glucosamine N-acyltransferase [Rhodospirillaceae bacterium]|nr:MAG: UDP-3-O-(3-hydroxymyristoyl)glucosamine N-acyltransferase [Alphaproteobacteria bacterium GWF2_58_20]HAU28490.1 UDP-3-O-(3-hydroxymyristoyl)glucosamine N-acyltransferase [Rhodospirillaceae bacterium]
MPDSRFHHRAGPFSLARLAEIAKGTLPEGVDPSMEVVDVAPLGTAGATDISFLDNHKYLEAFQGSKAGACIVHPDFAHHAPRGMALILTPSPYKSYAFVAQAFYPDNSGDGTLHPAAIIDKTASLGEGCTIEAGAVIGAHAHLGNRCHVHPNAVIGPHVEIGDDTVIGACASLSHCLVGAKCRIFPGARIGQDGFGFAMDAAGHIRIPQMGRVIIEDDVEIGANSCVDRGAGPDTMIAKGVRIDNLVQIAHNVQVGEFCVMAGQAGIAGSARLDSHVILGGQAGVTGHVKIGAGTLVAAKSAIMKDVPPKSRMMGIPARPDKDFLRQMATLARMSAKKGKKNTDD